MVDRKIQVRPIVVRRLHYHSFREPTCAIQRSLRGPSLPPRPCSIAIRRLTQSERMRVTITLVACFVPIASAAISPRKLFVTRLYPALTDFQAELSIEIKTVYLIYTEHK